MDVRSTEKQRALPFDQHQRYKIVADTIEKLRDGFGALRILDVGGGDGIILNFLPDDEVVILDQTKAEGVPGFVEGDATALPFENEAFDYTVSVDVYEHIRPADRDKYLSELRRVARKGILLAAPFDSDAVRSAEKAANEFHRAIHLTENVWLQEHAENGLPELGDARRFFEEHEDTLSVLPNGYIPHWLAMICLTFYSSKLKGGLDYMFDQLNTFYNEALYGLDNVEPCYRYLLISLKGSVNVDFEELKPPDPEAEPAAWNHTPFGTLFLSTVLPLAAEARGLNARLARKEAQVKDLSRRLAEQVNEINVHQSQAEHSAARLQQAHNQLQRTYESSNQKNAHLEHQRNNLQRQLAGVTSSRTWRVLSVQRRFRLLLGRVYRALGRNS